MRNPPYRPPFSHDRLPMERCPLPGSVDTPVPVGGQAAPSPAPLSWKKQILTNTGTNYLRTALRLVTGVVTFRLLYQSLPAADFGFWALLWSLFGYTVLLDFGMGTAAQRETARHAATGNWLELSRTLSTLVLSFVVLGALLLGGLLLVEPWFLEKVHVPVAQLATYGHAYTIFFVFLALSFPLGLYYEVLNGLQRIDICNGLTSAGMIANLAFILWAAHAHASFPIFVLIGVGTSVAPHLGAWYYARKLLPEVRVSWRLFNPAEVKPVLAFSFIAYLIMFRNFLIARTDQLTISWFLGVAVVAVYQGGFKMTELFNSITWQLQDCLSSVAAHLHARGERGDLIGLLLESSRVTAALTIPVYAFTAVYMNALLQLITGMKQVTPEMEAVGQILILAASIALVSGGCSSRILLMCGWERPLLRLTMAEGVAKLVLSIVCVQVWGLTGLACATLIPMAAAGCLGVVPLTLRFAHLSLGTWIREVLGRPLLPIAGSLLLLFLLSQVPLGDSLRLLALAGRGLLVMAPVLLYLANTLRGFFAEAPSLSPVETPQAVAV